VDLSIATAAEGVLARADYNSSFQIGGISVGFRGGCESDVAMDYPLALFRSGLLAVDIDISVEWVHGFVCAGSQIFDSGSTWRMYRTNDGFQFDFSAPFFGDQPYKRLLTNSDFTRATLQLNATCAARNSFPGAALSYPLDELLIMHRLTEEKAIELHGTGIVRPNGEANLFVGHSGAGKSTTTRLWTAVEDVEVLSDDRIIVRRDGSVMEIPREVGGGASEHEVLRLRDCSASRNNLCAQDDKTKKMRMYGTPWHGEAMYASPNSALLSRIFVLEHGHGNVIMPLSSSQAVAELFARSFVPFHRHEYVDSALTFLEELVEAVPIYRYAFEPDQCAVEKILHFHD